MARIVMERSISDEPLRSGPSFFYKNIPLMSTVSSVLVYFVLSIGLGFYQRWLGKQSTFPLAITTTHFVIKFFLSAVYRILWQYVTKKSRKTLSWKNFVLKIAPAGLTSGLDVGLSNWSLEFIALPLYSTTKSTSVIFILLFALLFRLEEKSWSIFFIVFMISGGLAMFMYHSTEFHFFGFLLALLASALSGVRWTLAQFLMQRSELGLSNPVDMMYHVQPWMIFSSLLLLLLFQNRIINVALSGAWNWIYIYHVLLSSLVAFAMEISEFLVVFSCSGLFLSIVGVVKEVAIVILALESQKYQMTPINYLGLVVCVFGVMCHVAHKMVSKKPESSFAMTKLRDEAAAKFLTRDSSSSEDELDQDSASEVLFNILQNRDEVTIPSFNVS